MELPVVVRSLPNQRVSAQVVGVPELVVEADSEQAALADVQVRYQQWLGNGKLVHLPRRHRLAELAGVSKDDPFVDEFWEEIHKYRREVDAREAARLDDENERLSA